MSPTLPDPAEPPVENPGFRDLDPNGVIEQPFWERYNTRLEMPVSVAIAALMLVCAGALMVLMMAPAQSDKAPPALRFLGGDDEEGDGSPGGGGSELAVGKPVSGEAETPITQTQLNDVKKEIRDRVDVGTGDVEIPDGQAEALARLDKDIRDKLLGAKPGSGSGPNGGDIRGNGPGGFGASSTYARGLRWIMKFDTNSGQDYINQIGGIGGVMLVPVPPDNKALLLFKNLLAPQGVPCSDAELAAYSKLIQFGESNRDTVASVGEALKLTFKPNSFFVYFPAELEEKLAALEKNYNSKAAEQIRSTTFKVVQKGGGYDFVVTDQKTR